MPQTATALVQRFDATRMDRVEERPDGTLLCEAVFTRYGVFDYVDGDGNLVRELRPPEVVLDSASVASLRLRPLTNDHPPDMVEPANAGRYTVGAVGDTIAQRGDGLAGLASIYESGALDAVRAGKRELSCGYWANVVTEYTATKADGSTVEYRAPGIWTDDQGQSHQYDAIQTDVVYNHVSIVDEGRAGPTVRLRMDGKRRRLDRAFQRGASMPTKRKDADPKSKDAEASGETVEIHGVTFTNVEPGLAVAIALLQGGAPAPAPADEEAPEVPEEEEAPEVDSDDEDKPKGDAMSPEVRAQLDALKAENARLKADRKVDKAKEARAKTDAAVRARVALERKADSYFDEPQDWSEKSDHEVMLDGLKAASPGLKLDAIDLSKQDDQTYVATAWRVVNEQRETADSSAPLRVVANDARSAGAPRAADTRSTRDAAWSKGAPKLSISK